MTLQICLWVQHICWHLLSVHSERNQLLLGAEQTQQAGGKNGCAVPISIPACHDECTHVTVCVLYSLALEEATDLHNLTKDSWTKSKPIWLWKHETRLKGAKAWPEKSQRIYPASFLLLLMQNNKKESLTWPARRQHCLRCSWDLLAQWIPKKSPGRTAKGLSFISHFGQETSYVKAGLKTPTPLGEGPPDQPLSTC